MRDREHKKTYPNNEVPSRRQGHAKGAMIAVTLAASLAMTGLFPAPASVLADEMEVIGGPEAIEEPEVVNEPEIINEPEAIEEPEAIDEEGEKRVCERCGRLCEQCQDDPDGDGLNPLGLPRCACPCHDEEHRDEPCVPLPKPVQGTKTPPAGEVTGDGTGDAPAGKGQDEARGDEVMVEVVDDQGTPVTPAVADGEGQGAPDGTQPCEVTVDEGTQPVDGQAVPDDDRGDKADTTQSNDGDGSVTVPSEDDATATDGDAEGDKDKRRKEGDATKGDTDDATDDTPRGDIHDVLGTTSSVMPIDPATMRHANARRIYSALSVWGLTDEEIAGMLSNIEAECGIDPTTIEGIYDEPYTMAGTRKSTYGKDAESLSAWALRLLVSDWGYGGTLGDDGHVHGAHVGNEYSVAADFYGPADDGLFYPGIGIGSWTGRHQVSSVLDGTERTGMSWWDIDYQVACLLAYPGDGSQGPAIYDRYASDCKGMTATECAEWFLSNWEGCPGIRVAQHVGTADAWLATIQQEKWEPNLTYAKAIYKTLTKMGTEIGSDDRARLKKLFRNVPDVSLSSLADTLVSCSYSRRASFSDGCPGTDAYMSVYGTVAPGDSYTRSCDRAVASAIRWSGIDPEFPMGDCVTQYAYCMQHGERWRYVGTFQASAAGKTADDEAKAAGLLPGDVLVAEDGEHTMAYVGQEAVRRVYKESIAGHASPRGGDLGQPSEGSAWVSASIGEGHAPSGYDWGDGTGRAPCVGTGADATTHRYGVFRWVGANPSDGEDTLRETGTATRLARTGQATEDAEEKTPATLASLLGIQTVASADATAAEDKVGTIGEFLVI